MSEFTFFVPCMALKMHSYVHITITPRHLSAGKPGPLSDAVLRPRRHLRDTFFFLNEPSAGFHNIRNVAAKSKRGVLTVQLHDFKSTIWDCCGRALECFVVTFLVSYHYHLTARLWPHTLLTICTYHMYHCTAIL